MKKHWKIAAIAAVFFACASHAGQGGVASGDAVINQFLSGAMLDLAVTFALWVLLRMVRNRSRRRSKAALVPAEVDFVAMYLFSTFATALVAQLQSPFKEWDAPVVFAYAVMVLKLVFAIAILRRYVWPRRVFLTFGILLLAIGILEGTTIPSGIWNDLAIQCVFGGIANLFMYSLLVTNAAESWRHGLEERQPEDDNCKNDEA